MKNSSLFKELIITRWPWRLTIVLTSFLAAGMGLIAPFFQKEFVDRLTLAQPPQASFAFLENISTPSFVALAFVCLLLAQAFQQLTAWLGSRESFLMQQVFAKKIYDKTLSLRVDTMTHRPIGEIVQLYATDVPGATVFLDQTLPAGATTLFPLILAPFAIGYLFEINLAPILGAMFLIVALNTLMAFRQSRFFFRFKQLAGERIGLVNEWIQNIRTIRILGWTHFVEDKIFEKREVETINRIRMVTNGQMMNSLSSSVTFLLNVSALLSLILLSGHSITPGELLALLWIVGVFLTRPFRQMPWFFTFAFDSWTSMQRLQKFLDITNETPNYQNNSSTLPAQLNSITDDNVALDVQHLSLNIRGSQILSDISFKIQKGEFIAIVGEVGSGKSMLLLSLIGETGAQFADYKILGTPSLGRSSDEIRKNFAYVPQEGFIMSASLRENVAFLYDIASEEDHSIAESLSVAQFDLQAERVSQGLDTEIGERGVNLSGGQRQRISLARVHYDIANILLLDDCLSAVDLNTESKLLHQLTRGAWKNRTRLLVTHRLSVLPKVDRILFLKNGELIATGSYEELLNSNSLFKEFTATVAQSEVQKEEAPL